MSEKKKSNKGLVAIIILLLIGLAGMGYMYMEKDKTVEAKDVEIQAFLQDLEAKRAEISSMESRNDSLDEFIVNREAALLSLIDSVQDAQRMTSEELARYKNSYYRMDAQIKELEASVRAWEARYDSLDVANQQTKMELAGQIEMGQVLEAQNQNLSNEVAAGSVLKLTSIFAGAYKVSSSGEEDETSRTRRAERVKTCITIGANAIASKGNRDVVMRVMTPSGNVLVANRDSTADGSNMFNVNGNSLGFTARKDVWFEGEETNVCLSFDHEEWDEGTYTVEIYIDGKFANEARFILD